MQGAKQDMERNSCLIAAAALAIYDFADLLRCGVWCDRRGDAYHSLEVRWVGKVPAVYLGWLRRCRFELVSWTSAAPDRATHGAGFCWVCSADWWREPVKVGCQPSEPQANAAILAVSKSPFSWLTRPCFCGGLHCFWNFVGDKLRGLRGFSWQTSVIQASSTPALQ